MATNPNNLLGQSNPNGTVGVSLGIDPAGANEAFSAGVTSGFTVAPTNPAAMSIDVGGESGVIDSALVRSASGITFPVGNTSGTAITLTVPAAPSTNSRIDSIVLYVDTSVTATETDGADALGMEIVSGTSASSPIAPTDAQIRAAIENGASIAYIVIANITVASGATTITSSDIEQSTPAQLGASKVDFATYRTVLFDDASGATSATLSESAANFRYLDIWGCTSDGTQQQWHQRVYSPNNKTIFALSMTTPSTVNLYAKAAGLFINDTSITITKNYQGSWTGSSVTAGTYIKITHVEGVERVS